MKPKGIGIMHITFWNQQPSFWSDLVAKTFRILLLRNIVHVCTYTQYVHLCVAGQLTNTQNLSDSAFSLCIAL